MTNEKKDFFVSYNDHDKQWAEWIAWHLEKAGYQVMIQLWDWGPGSNFILEMQKAADRCERTILVLSPHFLSSLYTQPEWAQAFAKDPTGEKRLLIPVRVEQCELKGFFKPLVYIDFLESQPLDKHERRQYLIEKLIDGVKLARRKPVAEPLLPDFKPTSVVTTDAAGDTVTENKRFEATTNNNDNKTDSNFYGQQRAELLRYFVSEWLVNGPVVAILQGFPGCGKTQLASAIAAKAIHCIDPVEPQLESQNPSLDLLTDLALALDYEGIHDLMQELDKGADGNLFDALLKVLRRERVLIVVDEFQRLLSDKDTLPPKDWQYLMERLNNSNRPAGRLLLISNRSIKNARWCEKAVSKELKGLTDSEAAGFLQTYLASKELSAKIPSERLEEIGHRLGGNPRALKTMVESLKYFSLEELISLAPDLFKPGDVKLNPDLVEDFERELIERTLSCMEVELLKFMRWLAVYRRPFNKDASLEIITVSTSQQSLRKQLIERFLLETTDKVETLHPLAREISVTRLREDKDEWQQAHSLAADYYFKYFRDLQLRESRKLTSSYAELRHHLFESARMDELYLASDKLTKFALSLLPRPAQSKIPDNLETLEEHIALISALPEMKRPKGLEYHLALCLKHRNTGDDYRKALFHVRRATGPHAYYAVWLLLIELEYNLNGVNAMLRAQKEAIRFLGSGSNAFTIYHRCAHILMNRCQV